MRGGERVGGGGPWWTIKVEDNLWMATTHSDIRLWREVMGTIILHEHTHVGTILHCTVLVTAHCPPLKTGNSICMNRSISSSLQHARA